MTVPRIPQQDHLAKPAKAPRQQLKNDPENNVLLTGHEIQKFQMKTVSVNTEQHSIYQSHVLGHGLLIFVWIGNLFKKSSFSC